MQTAEDFARALVISLPCVIKARQDGNRRLVDVEASNEEVDSEGDCILQRALLGSAAEFLKSGTVDIDHLSIIGDRLGIQNPTSYIVGKPDAVTDLGDGRTGVTVELNNSAKANEIWDSLNLQPPVPWRASIYGFPVAGEIIDCRKAGPGVNTHGATRYLVRKLRWASLAFTRSPINQAIEGIAHIVSAKSYTAIMKSRLTATTTQTTLPTARKQMPKLTALLKRAYSVAKAEEDGGVNIDGPRDPSSDWNDLDRLPGEAENPVGSLQSASGGGGTRMVADYMHDPDVRVALTGLAGCYAEMGKKLDETSRTVKAMLPLLIQLAKANSDDDEEPDEDKESEEKAARDLSQAKRMEGDEEEDEDLEKSIPTISLKDMMNQLAGRVKKSAKARRAADRRVSTPPNFSTVKPLAISKADDAALKRDYTFEEAAAIGQFKQRLAAYRAGKLPHSQLYIGLGHLPSEYCNVGF